MTDRQKEALDCFMEIEIPLGHKVFSLPLPRGAKILPYIRPILPIKISLVYSFNTRPNLLNRKFYLLKEEHCHEIDFSNLARVEKDYIRFEPITEDLNSADYLASFTVNNFLHHLFVFKDQEHPLKMPAKRAPK